MFLEVAAAHVVNSALPSLFVNEGYKAMEGLLSQIINYQDALDDLEINHLTALRIKISKLDTFLEEVEIARAIETQSNKLAVLTYDVEDLLADMKRKSASVFRPFKGPGICNLGEELRKILRELRNLVEELIQRSERKTKPQSFNGQVNPERPLIGRETEKMSIIELRSPSSSSTCGVTIVGIRGIGKTMLAASILQDSQVTEHFRTLPSTVFDGSLPYNDIIHAMKEKLNELRGSENAEILDQQHNKTWLIVIDNLMDSHNHLWNKFFSDFKSMFGPDLTILVTSTNPQIQKITGTSVCVLKPLSDADCKQVITDTASMENDGLDTNHLTSIAGKLAEKCHGLPLAAVMFGLVLRREDNWTDILNKDIWKIADFKKEVFPTLRLSWLNMRACLQQCLAYFSLFPDSHEYSIDELIQLWIAEGFIPRPDAYDLFEELLGTSILEHDRDSARYKLHKFNHDLSRLAAPSTFLFSEVRNQGNSSADPTSYTNVRHLSLSCKTIERETWRKFRKTRLRTFIALHPATELPPQFQSNLKRLRVLSLKETQLTELPKSIDKLKNLHCLDISNNPNINILPDKLSNITTLEFLRIRGTSLSCLPADFQKLTNLVFVDWGVSDIKRLLELPSHIGKLSQLENLPLFPVHDKEGYTIAELKDMCNLRGSIRITGLQNVKSRADAEAADLHNKKFLEELELEWRGQVDDGLATQEILRGLKPHDNLKKLTITNGMFPDWLCDKERQLETIHLMNCRSNNALPVLGELPILKTLKIEGANDLEHMNSNFCGNSGNSAVLFKSLSSLTLESLSALEEWTGLGPADMPKLRELKIINCPKLMSMPSLQSLTSLVHLQIECCQTLSLPDVPTSITSLIIKDCPLLNDCCNWEIFCKNRKVIIDGYIL